MGFSTSMEQSSLGPVPVLSWLYPYVSAFICPSPLSSRVHKGILQEGFLGDLISFHSFSLRVCHPLPLIVTSVQMVIIADKTCSQCAVPGAVLNSERVDTVNVPFLWKRGRTEAWLVVGGRREADVTCHLQSHSY